MPKGYSSVQIALHWIVAVLIAGQFLFNEPITEAFDSLMDGKVPPFDIRVMGHVAGGAIILALVLWRLVLRRRRGAPPPPESAGRLLGLAATLGHVATYALMLLIPVSGLVAWFGGVAAAGEAHEVMGTLLLVVVALHVLAAFWHQFWLKDHLLARMMRAER